jgi:excisionase family DNA binding protein
MRSTAGDEELPILVSVETAARLLGLSRAMAYELAARGELPTVRFGRSVRIHRRELERWVDRAAQVPTAAAGN